MPKSCEMYNKDKINPLKKSWFREKVILTSK